MWAATSVRQQQQQQYADFTDLIFCLQKVKINERNSKGENARALAMMYGYTKIVSLIDSHSPRIKLGIFF